MMEFLLVIIGILLGYIFGWESCTRSWIRTSQESNEFVMVNKRLFSATEYHVNKDS
jgi:hypothetical protein